MIADYDDFFLFMLCPLSISPFERTGMEVVLGAAYLCECCERSMSVKSHFRPVEPVLSIDTRLGKIPRRSRPHVYDNAALLPPHRRGHGP